MALEQESLQHFGEEQAAMSELAMSINGILTVIIIPIVMNFIL